MEVHPEVQIVEPMSAWVTCGLVAPGVLCEFGSTAPAELTTTVPVASLGVVLGELSVVVVGLGAMVVGADVVTVVLDDPDPRVAVVPDGLWLAPALAATLIRRIAATLQMTQFAHGLFVGWERRRPRARPNHAARRGSLGPPPEPVMTPLLCCPQG